MTDPEYKTCENCEFFESQKHCCFCKGYFYFEPNNEIKIQVFEKENAELKEQNKDLCKSLDIMNNRESELLDQIEKMKKDFSNALDSAYSNQALYELWKRWESAE